jgi:hypothetical protein
MMTLAAVVMLVALQPPSAEVEAANKEFLDLEVKLLGAAQLKNTQVLEEMLSPGFGFSLMIEGRSPEILSRPEWLRLTDAYSRLDGFELHSVAAFASGDQAVVRAQLVRRGSVGAKDLSGEYVYVDLWGKEDGAWKIRYRVVARPVPPLTR